MLGPSDYASYICSLAAIRDRIAKWLAETRLGDQLGFVSGATLSPVRIIRDALAKCPDESPAPGTSDLTFISDADLRANLRNDVGAISRALSNSEWKAATVLAGSAIEALLLWAIQQHLIADVANAVNALHAAGTLSGSQGRGPIDKWHLGEYIEVAEKLGAIEEATAIQSRLAKDFRNFIHPGRAQRLGQKCDRATALSAIAGMEHVIRDLT